METLGYEPLVPEDRVRDVAGALGGILDGAVFSDYLDFLREFPRTGTFDADVQYFCRKTDGDDRAYSISFIFASCSIKTEDLLSLRKKPFETWKFDCNCMAIGSDIFGNYFFMGIDGAAAGKIYYWNHEIPQSDTTLGNLVLLSSSFHDFILGLEDVKYNNVGSQKSGRGIFGGLFNLFKK